MKWLALLAVASMGMMSACSYKMVEPGYVGVKVYRAGGDKGVDNQVIGVGRYWLTYNEDVYTFPVFQQNYSWTASHHEGRAVDESITIQSKEGMGINMDLGISYEIDPAKVAVIFQKYRKGIDELTDVVLRNAVRDALTHYASDLAVEQIIGNKKTFLVDSALKEVQDEFAPTGIKIDKLFLIGEMRPPNSVKEALNSKIEATQKAIQAENEVRQAKAEADKARETARGVADANRIKMQSLTPELIRYEAIQKWDGKLPQMTGGGAIPFIQVEGASFKK